MNGEHEASGQQASQPGSSVLSRMIQRTRERRPSLEPVIQPLFAPHADRFARGQDPVPDAPPPDLPPPDAPPSDVLALAAFPPDARQPEVPPPDVLLPEAPDAAVSRPSSRRYPPDDPAAAREFPSPAGGSGPVMEAFAADIAAEDDLLSGNAPAFLPPVPPLRREYPSAQRSYRSAAPASGVPAVQERAPGPSVTITIGHIEVRAAPAPQRPSRPEVPPRPRPAFRPQTTLADFLDDRADRPGGSGRR